MFKKSRIILLIVSLVILLLLGCTRLYQLQHRHHR